MWWDCSPPNWVLEVLMPASRWAGQGLCHALYLERLYFTRLRVRFTGSLYPDGPLDVLNPFVTAPPCLLPLLLSAYSPHSSQGEPFPSEPAHTLPGASLDSANQPKVLTMTLAALHDMTLMTFPTSCLPALPALTLLKPYWQACWSWHSNHMPAPGPLHLPSPLPGIQILK